MERTEDEAFGQLEKIGLFSTKDEAARTAIVKYAADMGILNLAMLWGKIEAIIFEPVLKEFQAYYKKFYNKDMTSTLSEC